MKTTDVVTNLLGEVVMITDPGSGNAVARGAVRGVYVAHDYLTILIEYVDWNEQYEGSLEMFQLANHRVRLVQKCETCAEWDLKKRLVEGPAGTRKHRLGEDCAIVLHRHRAHPDFEYATTETTWKPVEGDGWELNDVFESHEVNYWRRRR